MNIPPKYEDLVFQLNELNKREAALREEIEMAKQVQEATDAIVTMADGQRDNWIEKCGLLKQRLTVAERRESEAREELLDLSRKLDVFYSRSHGIKNLSAIEDANDKSKALQQRLTVAEQRADDLEGLLRECQPALDKAGYSTWQIDEALKPAVEVEAIGTRPVGCCCPPKGHTGIWAAAMCPVHFGLKRHGVSHDQ